ncbi:MAG: CCXG family PEP-CTERM protein [Myxococcota bacterium]|nr:CCXG family PEP-CTERM protein [Myxococcota bacterium]
MLRTPDIFRFVLATLASLLLAASATALTIDVSFTASTYATTGTDDHASLLVEHGRGAALGSARVTTLEGVSTSVYASGERNDYSLWMTSTFTVARAGNYTFQVGTDWGRGGAASLFDDSRGVSVAELVRTDDIWWANDFGHADVFTLSGNLDAGMTYTLSLVGFEGCCGGASTVRFSHEGSAFAVFNEPNLRAFVVPELASAVLLPTAVAGLFAARRRRDATS